MADDCISAAQAKATGALPINPKFEGVAPNAIKYGDAVPAQPNDTPTKTGW